MRKIFLLTALLTMIFMSTAFAEEVSEAKAEENDGPYIYTSEDFKFTIACPFKPIAVVQNPWEEPEKRGELLVFANEGFDVIYGYVIQVNAFNNDSVPDFNKADEKIINDYVAKLKENNPFYSLIKPVNLTKDNKGLFAVTAKEFEVRDKETGEIIGSGESDREYAFTFFRTSAGRCIGIQLICDNIESKEQLDTYRYSVASFKDNTEVKKADKKDKKDKKSKKDKKDKKNKKEKKNKDK